MYVCKYIFVRFLYVYVVCLCAITCVYV